MCILNVPSKKLTKTGNALLISFDDIPDFCTSCFQVTQKVLPADRATKGRSNGNCLHHGILRHVRLLDAASSYNHFAPPRKYNMVAALLARQRRTQRGRVGDNPPPLSLICYKTLLPAQRRLIVFAYFCLLICRLNANTTEWICMQIARNNVNGPKSND